MKCREIMEHIYNCTGHTLKIPDIVDSDGIYIFDGMGERYMDLESGTWSTSLGHKNKKINNVIKNQISILMHAGFCYSAEVLEKSAKSVLNITKFKNGKCVFLCSGSEAIEISRQVAKHLTGKKTSMTLHDSYLGAYASVTDRTKDWYLFNWEQCQTCTKNSNCDPLCNLLQKIPEDISEFVLEPGSSSGFVRFPPKAMIQNIVRIIRSNNGKILANEVTTGIGRTGMWFGYQHYGIEPDLIALGKGIGNGYPVSVAVINKDTAEKLERKPFKYSQSHQNDPLGAAVVKAVIQEIKKNDLITKAEQKGSRFLTQLKSLIDNKTVLAVRGRGLMFAVDLSDKEVTEKIYTDLIEHGYLVGNRGSSFRIDPPLIITETEFDEFINAFKSILLSS